MTISLGAKGVVELELVASGEAWGRGPEKDVHSQQPGAAGQPGVPPRAGPRDTGHADGAEPAIDGFADKARPLSPAERRW